MKLRGWDPQSVSMDLSYHREHEYIWFEDGNLNGFRDIRRLMKWKGWGMPQEDHQSVSMDASYHLFSK